MKKRKKYIPMAEKFISQPTVKVTKTLQEKFKWAMNIDENYKF